MTRGTCRKWIAAMAVGGPMALQASTSTFATNLVVNGGFEAGNTNFSSDYNYRDRFAGPLTSPAYLAAGDYSVWSDANQVHPSFSGSAYSGNYFFIANGGTSTTDAVWQSQAITITQTGVAYRFQAFISSVVPSNFAPPSLVFEISSNSGTTWSGLGSTVSLSGANAGFWYQKFADTTLTTTGTYLIRMRNLSTAASGNDFGLDNIYFGLASAAPTAVPGSGLAAIGSLGLAGLARRRRR
jgi:hypothetical protein